jgi:hypothetical protein
LLLLLLLLLLLEDEGGGNGEILREPITSRRLHNDVLLLSDSASFLLLTLEPLSSHVPGPALCQSTHS